MLPPLFKVDDYTSCFRHGNIYCKIRANLQSSVKDSEVWKYIEKSIEDEGKYRRDVLFRNLCIPKQTAYHDEAIKEFSKSLVNKELQQLNVSSSVDILACTDGSISITSFDYVILTLMILYGCLIAYATFQDFQRKNDEKDDGILRKFSLRYNWMRRTRSAQNEDNEKLKSIQGMRFYIIFLISICHAKLKVAISYSKNPFMLEQLAGLPIINPLNKLDVFWVLIFFMISSWLLTVQVCHIFRVHGELSLKHALILIINRYFRMVVTLAVIIPIINSSWFVMLQGPDNFNLFENHHVSCPRNWPATLLLFNNFYYLKDVCMGTTWYLSADFQMYVVNTLILYFIFKFNLSMNKTFSTLLVAYSLMYGLIIYIYDTDMVFKINIRNIQYGGMFSSFSFFLLYTSTFSICSGSCIGMILGASYFKKSFRKNNIWTHFYTPASVILLSITAMILTLDSKGLEAALLGPLVKILFTLGFGIGILGMSQSLGGIMKRIFEWKPVVLLGNFTFCIYVCQTLVCFTEHTLPEVGIIMIVQKCIINMLYAVPIGIFLTLTVEEPGLTLQKMLLPQVRKYSEQGSEKTKSN